MMGLAQTVIHFTVSAEAIPSSGEAPSGADVARQSLRSRLLLRVVSSGLPLPGGVELTFQDIAA